MDIRSIANQSINTINPNISVQYYKSTGYEIGEGCIQTPIYDDPVTMFAQMQKVNANEYKRLEMLTKQGILWKFSVRGEFAGIVRLTSQGGDKLVINGVEWYVLLIREQWPNWCSAIVVMQEGAQ